MIVYWIDVKISLLTVVFDVLLLFAISAFVLTLACILGWVVAKLSSKMKSKTFARVFLSLVFLAIYYYVYYKAYSILQQILVNAVTIGAKVKGAVYPLYMMGRAGEGHAVDMLLFALVVAALFAIVYLILSKSFFSMATANGGEAKKKQKTGKTKVRSMSGALLFKERGRFTSSSSYMLNCGLGTVFILILAAAIVIKGAWLRDLALAYGMEGILPAAVCAAVCMITSMNDITAPSVSLEGKNIWIVQSFPIPAWNVLKAKLKLHLLLTEIPTLICCICAAAVLCDNPMSVVLVILLPLLFVLFMAELGLAVNLKMPNLNWKDETVPLKQSLGVMIAIFGGWIMVILLGILCFLLRNVIEVEVYLIACVVLIGLLSAMLMLWLKNRGSKIFEQL